MIGSLKRRPGKKTQSQITKTSLEIQSNVAKTSLSAPLQNNFPNTALLARRVPLDMTLPGEQESLRIRTLLKRNRYRRLRRGITKAVSLCLVMVMLFGGLVFTQGYFKIHKSFRGTASAAPLKTYVNPNLLKGEDNGRINILLLGRGGGNHEGPDLTDSMMLVSIDPINNTATLLSIPRDLWVSVSTYGLMKINSAWETGEFQYLGKIVPGSTNPNAINAGFKLADQTVSQVLGVNIDYNAIIDFQAFQQAVTALNGVNIDVPSELVDPTMAWENKGNPILAEPGAQTFNGNQALNYVRSRETSSDFARAQRQRAVLEAIIQKSLTLGTISNPLKVTSLINSFGDNVSTNLSLTDAVKLANIVKNISTNNYSSVDLDNQSNPLVSTANIDGQSVVIPSAGLFNYNAIHQFVTSQLKSPYILKENAKILILNGTDVPGLATNLAAELQPSGYNIVGVANTPTSIWQQTKLIDLNSKDIYTDHYLETKLGIKSQSNLPNNSIPSNGADFVIIIGSNEANSNQN